MVEGRRKLLMGAALGVAATVATAAVVGMVVVYSGAVNPAATEEHASLTRWALDTSFHSGVRSRAGTVDPPPAFTPAMIEAGARGYKAMCQHCHSGPGAERETWSAAMRPRPPHLAEAAAEWSPQEVFWIAKHGVRSTGMPAFGPSHDDATLWEITAFVKALPGMSPERYRSLGGQPQGGGDAAPGHGH
jgi:mono/diheme cytochrome c family protein